MKNAVLYFLGVCAVCGFIYGGYWLAKHGSYWLFYEEMVQSTVREMVKQEALK